MNTKLFFTAIAIVATFSIAVTAITTNVSAQNMTDGNMTGGNMTMGPGNMTDANMTEASGSISTYVNEINTLRWNYSSVSTCNDNCRFRNHATAQLMADNATMAGNMTGGNMTMSAGDNMTSMANNLTMEMDDKYTPGG